jgi:hypothetical protein
VVSKWFSDCVANKSSCHIYRRPSSVVAHLHGSCDLGNRLKYNRSSKLEHKNGRPKTLRRLENQRVPGYGVVGSGVFQGLSTQAETKASRDACRPSLFAKGWWGFDYGWFLRDLSENCPTTPPEGGTGGVGPRIGLE